MSEVTIIKNTIVGAKDKLRDGKSFFPAKVWGYHNRLLVIKVVSDLRRGSLTIIEKINQINESFDTLTRRK